MSNKLDVVELFAGVGGFRCGLEDESLNNFFNTIWTNQWEPSTKKQHAYDCYCSHFPNTENSNKDINDVINEVPKHELLVGGFPCQDYSVASTGAKGIEGKKGVLWWAIYKIIEKWHPKYILLENVDRLIRSPRENKGRDFSIILRCLSDLGYFVEWRIINAADYGHLQKRKRIFIFASRFDTKYSKSIKNDSPKIIISSSGFFQKNFPIESFVYGKKSIVDLSEKIYPTIKNLSDYFQESPSTVYYNSGIMVNGVVFSYKINPLKSKQAELEPILSKNVPERYYIPDCEIQNWKYYKDRKAEPRKSKKGFEYFYKEGKMLFPDDIHKPARTILTSEGQKNRSTHIIMDPQTNRLRRLTPEECEIINGFNPGWTINMPERKRFFTMGNSLVVPLITKMGKRIMEID